MVVFVFALDPDESDSFESMGTVTRYTFSAFIVLGLVIVIGSFNKNGCSVGVWHLITHLQFMRWVPLINSQQPATYDAFFEKLALSLNQFEFFPEGAEDHDDERFRQLGIKSYTFLSNAEEEFLLWLAFALVSLLIFFAKRRCGRIVYGARLNIVLRASLVFYLDLMLLAMVQVQRLDFSTGYFAVSAVLSVFMLIAGVFFAFVVPITAKMAVDKYGVTGSLSHLHIISALTEEFVATFPEASNYYSVFCILRLITAGSYLLFSGNVYIQLFVLLGSEVILIAYIAYAKPWGSLLENWAVMVGEFSVLVVILLTGCFSFDDIPDEVVWLLSLLCVLFVWVGIIAAVARFLIILQIKPSINLNVGPALEISTFVAAPIDPIKNIEMKEEFGSRTIETVNETQITYILPAKTLENQIHPNTPVNIHPVQVTLDVQQARSKNLSTSSIEPLQANHPKPKKAKPYKKPPAKSQVKPQDAPPEKDLSKEVAPKKDLPKESIPKESLSKGLSKKDLHKEELPQEELPKEELPKEELPKNGLPKEELPEETPPEEPEEQEEPSLFINSLWEKVQSKVNPTYAQKQRNALSKKSKQALEKPYKKTLVKTISQEQVEENEAVRVLNLVSSPDPQTVPPTVEVPPSESGGHSIPLLNKHVLQEAKEEEKFPELDVSARNRAEKMNEERVSPRPRAARYANESSLVLESVRSISDVPKKPGEDAYSIPPHLLDSRNIQSTHSLISHSLEGTKLPPQQTKPNVFAKAAKLKK